MTTKTTQALRVIAYARVSTTEQADGGVSLAMQESKLKAYCELYDLELVKIVVDGGESAKSLKRPGITEALAMLKAGQADGLVVLKLDRLTRSVSDLNYLIEGYFCEKAGRHLFSVTDAIDTRSASGRLVLNILASISQWEREIIAERTSEALQHKRKTGQRAGQLPYGFNVAEDGKTLVQDEQALAAAAIVAGLKASGMTYRQIVDEMNRRVPPTQDKKWHLSTVQKALKLTAA